MTCLSGGHLRGAFTPVVTPFKDGHVAYDTYARLIEFQVKQGAHGVLVNGTTAEPSTLTVDERNRLVDTAVEVAAGRIPVIAATGSQSLAETRQLTEHAADRGVDALLVVTPYYICPSQRGLVAYYTEVGRISPIPLMMYHIPGRAAVSATVDTLEELRAKVPSFIGMKHAANDLVLVSEALQRCGREFRIFVGLEDLSLPMLAIGACGLMNAVGNLVPQRIAALYGAASSGNLAEANRLHHELYSLNRAVFFDTNPQPVKYMMMRLGLLPENEHRLPMLPVDAKVARRLDQVMENANLAPFNGARTS